MASREMDGGDGSGSGVVSFTVVARFNSGGMADSIASWGWMNCGMDRRRITIALMKSLINCQKNTVSTLTISVSGLCSMMNT